VTRLRFHQVHDRVDADMTIRTQVLYKLELVEQAFAALSILPGPASTPQESCDRN